MSYIAIIGDIIDSQKISNRDQVQDQLQKILKKVNNDYQKQISANFAITLGDEFQGLLRTGDNALAIIQEIEFAIHPVKIRFGIGMGEVRTEINRNKSHEIDGPAYHRARKMIDRLKKTATGYEKVQRNIFVSSHAGDHPDDELMNATLSICYALREGWTDKQLETIQTYLDVGKNQYLAAEKLGVGQSTVSRSLLHSKYYTYENAIAAVQQFLTTKHAELLKKE